MQNTLKTLTLAIFCFSYLLRFFGAYKPLALGVHVTLWLLTHCCRRDTKQGEPLFWNCQMVQVTQEIMTVLLQPGKSKTACFRLATSSIRVEIASVIVGLNSAEHFPLPSRRCLPHGGRCPEPALPCIHTPRLSSFPMGNICPFVRNLAWSALGPTGENLKLRKQRWFFSLF